MTSTEKALRDEWRKVRAEHSARLAGCSFKINGRFKTKLGVCRTSRATGLPVSVEVAKSLVMDPALREQAFDTFYHEVAHALAGHAAGHGPEWKAWCRKLGANPQRLADLTTEQRALVEQVTGGPPWTGTCEHCGQTYRRHRIANKGLVCGKCRGPLEWEHRDGRKRYTGAPMFSYGTTNDPFTVRFI